MNKERYAKMGGKVAKESYDYHHVHMRNIEPDILNILMAAESYGNGNGVELLRFIKSMIKNHLYFQTQIIDGCSCMTLQPCDYSGRSVTRVLFCYKCLDRSFSSEEMGYFYKHEKLKPTTTP